MIEIAQSGAAAGALGADRALALLQGALNRAPGSTRLKLPCHSAREFRWFSAYVEPLDPVDRHAAAVVGYEPVTREHLAGRPARRFECCSLCELRLPLLKPEVHEVPQSWACKRCGNRYRAVFDDLETDIANNVALISSPV